MKNLDLLAYWITERESIRRKKEAGLPRPWTIDPVLHRHHFCNVHRQDDRGTKELQELGKGVGTDDLPWFYTMARLFNHAPTVKIVLGQGRGAFNWPQREKVVDLLSGRKVFHTAYVVSTCGKKMDKLSYVLNLAEVVYHTPIPKTTCFDASVALMRIDGLGSFMAGQIVADLKNDRYLVNAPDKETFVCMGPGSKKGLDYMFPTPTNPTNFAGRIRAVQNELLTHHINGIDLQDLQNCMCEWSKYMRYKNQEAVRVRYYEPVV